MSPERETRPSGGAGAGQETSEGTRSDLHLTGGIRPPDYRSAGYDALPAGHPLRTEAMKHAADCWALLMSSPHIADLLAEWTAWAERRMWSESTTAMSAHYDWSTEASKPTYAELERRRNTYDRPALTPQQIRAAADYSWRRAERDMTRSAA